MNNKKNVHWQPARAPESEGGWFEAVGAGNSIAAVERQPVGEDRCEYRYTLARMEPGGPRRYSLDFRPEDVLDLPKLTQVLAATLVDDGWVDAGLKDELSCLADSLDWLLGLRGPSSSKWVVVKRQPLQEVLDYLWRSEIGRFRTLSAEERNEHIFHAVAELYGLLHGTQRTGEEDLSGLPEGARRDVQG